MSWARLQGHLCLILNFKLGEKDLLFKMPDKNYNKI